MVAEKSKQKIRTLEDVCEKEDFSIKILGNTYCSLSQNKKIVCGWQSEEKDQNELYYCLKNSSVN